jgi:ankyrin repeat protein
MLLGRLMNACNRQGETLVHLACRSGSANDFIVFDYLVANGGDVRCCDDLGRVPLHEVFRSERVNFDIARRIISADPKQVCEKKEALNHAAS